MKKTLFTFVALIALTLSAVAQDTINGDVRMGNYFYPDYWSEFKLGEYGTGNDMGFSGGGEFGVLYYTNDTLTVYGLAGTIYDYYRWSPAYLQDTSYTNSYEYLRLYKAVRVLMTDTLQCLAQAKVHLRTTPVSYYANHCSLNPPPAHMIYPVYERYFDTSVTVCDTFYIGMTNYIKRWNFNHQGYDYEFACPPLGAVEIGGQTPIPDRKMIAYLQNPDMGTPRWDSNFISSCLLILPILTPPDSNYVGNDSVGVPENSMLQRLTGVMPNPAAETAKVVSSFGLTMVEAFNMAGEKVHTLRLPDAPLTATLDVRRWPSGTYLLRIHTPQGTAVKKLVVN